MKIFKFISSPVIFPIIFFTLVILVGSILLHTTGMNTVDNISWTDSIFTATSAACVTGLTVVDTGSCFTTFGQIVIVCLIQIGGLGIMTLTSLSIYLWRRRTTIADRIAVGQILLHDTSFNLGKFLIEIVSWTFIIEFMGALLIYLIAPESFSPFSAIFHSISAYCNAGFSLFSDNLTLWQGDWTINLVFMTLIILGGIGFSVFIECKNYIKQKFLTPRISNLYQVSWYSKIVLRTSIFLIIFGWIAIYLSEFVGYNRIMAMDDALLTSLFQSVTCRTAGFNTINIGQMTNVSLAIILFLMFIGGAPGSCAGGIKVTTFRVMAATIISELKGKKQAVIGKFAINETAVKKSMVLFVVSVMVIFMAVFLLDFTEGGDKPHYQVRGQFLEILFESVSAFCTVGLSTGLTPKLSTIGKWIIISLMFIGRLGPFVLINALQSVHDIQYYNIPEEKVMIG
ncbi:MAG: potassium transporter TrkH [Candidatus Magnetomorum sp.]|nr:potassium transporter TrkH [Candidatus Magnetomorum sp.]